MSNRVPWIERKFDFSFPAELHPEILERLRGTPVRVEALVASLPAEILTKRDDNPWSIQDNIGHLSDVETLWLGRLDDFAAGAETLRPADMTNRKTHEAGHNDRPIAAVLQAFREARRELVDRLERLPAERFAATANHPRLNQPMRIVDMMYFIAEHDDYHLARITELTRRFPT